MHAYVKCSARLRMETDVTGNNWQSTRYTLIGSVLEFNFIVSARQDTKPRSPVDTDFHVLDEVGLQRRRVKCINHYWYVRDDFYLGYKQRDLSFSIRNPPRTTKSLTERDSLFARGWIRLYIDQSYLLSSFERRKTGDFLDRFLFFLREKNLKWHAKSKGKESIELRSPFFFSFFSFLFIKKRNVYPSNQKRSDSLHVDLISLAFPRKVRSFEKSKSPAVRKLGRVRRRASNVTKEYIKK